MSVATKTAADVTSATVATGRSKDRTPGSLIFLVLLWFSLFFGVAVLATLIISTAIDGAPRFDGNLFSQYESHIREDETGFRAGILGSLWLMLTTAVFAVPLGIAAALYLEEFADNSKWWNRLIELNLQNLAAVPSVIYGMLAVAVLAMFAVDRTNTVIGGALALALLILPVIIITTREAVRAVPTEIRHGSLALGATVWQTTWRNTLPSAIPGIATGTILGISRAIGEAAPLVVVGLSFVAWDPSGLSSEITALPIQIYSLATNSKPEMQTAASAAIIVLLAMVLGLNAVAIFIRNKFTRSW
ncbi:phosphate ABC transporter permease PstA [Nocardioides sp.]|uniref:phosphate ABC transporter permease PstA n=1 Tax=Nocardioides sp. TaxID=35761 RepID=UPI002B930471|nr:phosphate ABC transporter permease PstA [Nocardioides sp.]HSX67347.1 phosphate ABC transporter permease PstA [Nocardioides sp.]